MELACGGGYCSRRSFVNGWFGEAAEYMLKSNDKNEFKEVTGSKGGC